MGLAAQYGIHSVPTLLLFKQGQVVEQVIGLRSKRDLKESLDRAASFNGVAPKLREVPLSLGKLRLFGCNSRQSRTLPRHS